MNPNMFNQYNNQRSANQNGNQTGGNNYNNGQSTEDPTASIVELILQQMPEQDRKKAEMIMMLMNNRR